MVWPSILRLSGRSGAGTGAVSDGSVLRARAQNWPSSENFGRSSSDETGTSWVEIHSPLVGTGSPSARATCGCDPWCPSTTMPSGRRSLRASRARLGASSCWPTVSTVCRPISRFCTSRNSWLTRCWPDEARPFSDAVKIRLRASVLRWSSRFVGKSVCNPPQSQYTSDLADSASLRLLSRLYARTLPPSSSAGVHQ